MSEHATVGRGTTAIEWATATWNPVTGCTKVSPGCAHCYIERSVPFRVSHRRFERGSTGVLLHENRLEQPVRRRKPEVYFVNSLSDLFHEEVPREFLLAMWAVMEAAPQHTYLILTKRPERMREILGAERPSAPPQPSYERRPIPGWQGYYADTEGAIWSDRRGAMKRLSPDPGAQGHLRVPLFDGSRRRGQRHLVHQLVLATFDRPAGDGEQGCHRDGNPGNNAISNLYWGTQQVNWADRNRHGTGRSWSKLAALDVAHIRIRALRGETAPAIARDFDISDTQVRNIVRGEQWGFKVLPSVWLGVTIENRRFVGRADLLRDTPAAVRFISAEPLLGPLVHDQLADPLLPYTAWSDGYQGPQLDLAGIDWLITGGESGPDHRRFDPQWARDLRDASRLAGTAFFHKQNGGRTPKAGGRELDGRTWDQLPANATEVAHA